MNTAPWDPIPGYHSLQVVTMVASTAFEAEGKKTIPKLSDFLLSRLSWSKKITRVFCYSLLYLNNTIWTMSITILINTQKYTHTMISATKEKYGLS